MFWHHVGNVLYIMFVWPGGIVVGNLLASIIWEWPSQAIHYWRTHHQNKKQTERIKGHIDNRENVKTGQ